MAADPLEAAKLINPNTEQAREKEREKERGRVGRPPKEQSRPIETATPVQIAVAEDFSAKLEEPASPIVPVLEPPTRYRVLETRVFMWGGYVTTLAQGGIVSSDGYGHAGIKRMLDQGFKLRPMEPSEQ